MNSFHSIGTLPFEDQLLFNRFGRGLTVPLAHQTVTAAFTDIVSKAPTLIAARECFGDERTITYAELDKRSNALANLLVKKHGLKPGCRVVCVYSRCVEMCIFILGVMKAGAQYVPIDGAATVDDNLKHVITDCGAAIVLCLPQFAEKVQRCMSSRSDPVVLSIGGTDALWGTGDYSPPDIPISPGDGAYVIYTSGTTGKPKGVDVTHEGTCNTLLNEPSKLGITFGTKVACVLMLGFDMCAWSILGAFMNGGTLVLRGATRPTGDRETWRSCLRQSEVVIITPSGGQKYLPQHEEFPNIKTIAVGGEPCPLSFADEWAPHANFWNVCGPTEISILNTAHLHKLGEPLTIGRPNPNTTLYILDEEQNPVRIGQPGLMWVGGLGVSRGYLNLPERSARVYQPDIFARNGRMMFNTGDLGRWLENGELEHLGRQDDQVKIKGCRVELDGVSATIEELPWVEKACALKIGEELWAFYSTHDSGIGEEEVLKQHLRSSLNHYAQPTKLVHVVSMPLTPIGKIDKRALKEIKNGEIESSHTSKRASNTITVMPYDPNIDIRVKPESLRAEAVPS